jgi:UDP-N-acetylmuramoyl-tripeptide--D-alanyl-D-alanine ligase
MMRAFTLAEAAVWLRVSEPEGAPAVVCEGVSTDTRDIREGDLFVALRGERFDGHKFVSQAKHSGAVAAVVDVAVADAGIPQLVVEDTVEALAALAAAQRDESRARFVAVTGSSGKTTVREMTAAILEAGGPVLVTRGNLNNHIGVPLTLFRLTPEHRFGVIELGASGVGEIAHTVAITRPHVAILTNAGQAHLEGFGGYDKVVQAKGEIIDGVVPGGVVVLNRDDPAFEIWRDRAGTRRVVAVSASGHPEADYRYRQLQVQPDGQTFMAEGPLGWEQKVHLGLYGEHNAGNALLAIAAARELGAGDDAVSRGLASLEPVKGRLQVIHLSERVRLVDDSYNANPASMRAALKFLGSLPGYRIAVLGAMAELGSEADGLHREIGEFARRQGIDRLLAVGPEGNAYLQGFGKGCDVCASHEEAVSRLRAVTDAPLSVLVKGSRSSAMDQVVEGLKEKGD